jgi:hypothetical protein
MIAKIKIVFRDESVRSWFMTFVEQNFQSEKRESKNFFSIIEDLETSLIIEATYQSILSIEKKDMDISIELL